MQLISKKGYQLALSEGLFRIIPFFTALYCAFVFNVDDFAYLGILIALNEIIFLVASNSIQPALRILYFKQGVLKNRQFIVHSLVNCLVITCLLWSISLLFIELNFINISLLILTCVFRTYFVGNSALIHCSGRISYYLKINIVLSFSYIILIVIFSQLIQNYKAWIYSIFISYFLTLTYILISNDFRGRKLSNFNILFKTLYFLTASKLIIDYRKGLHFLPQSLAWWAKNGLDRLIVAALFNNLTFAAYTLAFQLSAGIVVLANVANLMLIPKVNSYLKNEMIIEVDEILKSAVKFLSITLIFYSIIAIFIAYFFYIEKYPNLLGILALLMLAMMPYCFTLIKINVLYYFENFRFVSRCIVYSAASQILISAVLVVVFSIEIQFYVLVSVFINVLLYLKVSQKQKSILNKK